MIDDLRSKVYHAEKNSLLTGLVRRDDHIRSSDASRTSRRRRSSYAAVKLRQEPEVFSEEQTDCIKVIKDYGTSNDY